MGFCASWADGVTMSIFCSAWCSQFNSIVLSPKTDPPPPRLGLLTQRHFGG